MGSGWYVLDDDTGKAGDAKAPRGEMRAFREEHTEAALALNPELLGVAGHLPVLLSGGSTANIPDLVLVDELGRTTIVELKSKKATVADLAQLLGYAEHWRSLPRGQVDGDLRDLGDGAAAVGSATRLLADLADVPSFGAGALRRLHAAGSLPSSPASSLEQAAARKWGPDALPFLGRHARLILAAPRFDDACRDLAEALIGRMVHVELVRTRFAGDNHTLLFEWAPEVANPRMEATWAAVRTMWRVPELRDGFTYNGWAEHVSRASVSFSSRAVPRAKIYVDCDDAGRTATLSTTVPHGWFQGEAESKRKRRALTEALEEAVPELEGVGGGWLSASVKMDERGPKALEALTGPLARAVARMAEAAPRET